MNRATKYLTAATLIALLAGSYVVWRYERTLQRYNEALHSENLTLQQETAALRSLVAEHRDRINALLRLAAPEQRKRTIMDKIASLPPNSYVVVLGDSIAQRAPLPETACGLTVVNAAISGSRTSQIISFIEEMDAMNALPAGVVVALGVNDAQSRYKTSPYFRATYESLLQRLSERRVAVATLAPIDFSGSDGKNISAALASSIDGDIRSLASERKLPVVELNGLSDYATIDGLHPAMDSYASWITAILGGINAVLPEKCG